MPEQLLEPEQLFIPLQDFSALSFVEDVVLHPVFIKDKPTKEILAAKAPMEIFFLMFIYIYFLS